MVIIHEGMKFILKNLWRTHPLAFNNFLLEKEISADCKQYFANINSSSYITEDTP